MVALTTIGAVGGAVIGVLLAITFMGDPDSGDGSEGIGDYALLIVLMIGIFGGLGALLGAIAGALVWLVSSAWQSFARRFARPS
jgi:hypothetical protein